MARRYRINMAEYDIDDLQYDTADAMVRRYNANKRRVAALSRSAGARSSLCKAMQWEIGVVDRALRETQDGAWERALRLTCCGSRRYEDIDDEHMPATNRNAYYRARREFYWRVWTISQEWIGDRAGG